jgi:hypothetical protein
MSATSLQALMSVTSIPRIEREQALHELMLCIREFRASTDIEHRYWASRVRIAIREWRTRYEQPERAAFAAAVARSQQRTRSKAA